MIFVFEFGRGLHVFANEAEAIAHCKGLEVAEGDYLFFAEDGSPLKAKFSEDARIDIKENSSTYAFSNGVYSLEPGEGNDLISVLDHEVQVAEEAENELSVKGRFDGLQSIDEVRAFVKSR